MEYIPVNSPYYDEWMDIFPNRDYHQQMEAYLDKAGLIWLPVYKYNHSDIIYNTTGFSCPWDSGQCGYIFVTKEDVRKHYNVKRISKKLQQNIESILSAEVEIYSDWANGSSCDFADVA